MPKRNDIQSILLLGAGPIVIGQACEFDYSGTQACRALREEGYKVVLCNSNPATIMTDPEFADSTYIEPLEWQTLEKIIEREKPDALLPTMGGQTAINLALALEEKGVLATHNVQMIGASPQAFYKAENRDLFNQAMDRIGLQTAKSTIAESLEQALVAADMIGFPAIVRPSFTLGGSGSGIANNQEEFIAIVTQGLALSPTNQVLIDQSLLGWKEYELEVVRDNKDNAIIVCAIENVDPMGVHTGDSITVAPAQTLTDKEYQRMRNAAIAVLREIGVDTGGSNVQFAVNPEDGEMIVIEMNPRVSRSSALASKATGFPIARVAAKLAVGYTLDELQSEITSSNIPCSFEPTLDYVVVKIPRFTFEKFPQTNSELGTQMKSVGEVMALGGSFAEALGKALRGLETDYASLAFPNLHINDAQLRTYLVGRHYQRLWYIVEALRRGMHIETLYQLTRYDRWFLQQLQQIVAMENTLIEQAKTCTHDVVQIDSDTLRWAKRMGLSDASIAKLVGTDEQAIRNLRQSLQVHPVYKRVDSCAAEFATDTNYLYSTYWGEQCEAAPTSNTSIAILGGGPNRIGQGIEFDYCCVHASQALIASGYESIMINSNPETVSTDYDISDRLYFEPVTVEDVLEIARVEQFGGMIVHFGGQTPLRIARELEQSGQKIIGLQSDAIDRTEDRDRFSALVEICKLNQPANASARSLEEARNAAQNIGYPVMLRPSYVLGGRSMEIVNNEQQLETYIEKAVRVSDSAPVLIDRFLQSAIEMDVDAIADGERVIIAGIMRHIEHAGVHSGDSACTMPADLDEQTHKKIVDIVERIAKELHLTGLMNLQLALHHGKLYVLEVNPRASRTIPYVSKATGVPFARLAVQTMVGKKLTDLGLEQTPNVSLHCVKEVVFPWVRFPNVDPLLGPEMKSTGEVMGVGTTFHEAYRKALVGAGMHLGDEKQGGVLLSVCDEDKQYIASLAHDFSVMGYTIYATRGTAESIHTDTPVQILKKIDEGSKDILEHIQAGKITLVINTPSSGQSHHDSHYIRQSALRHNLAMATTIECGKAICASLMHCAPLVVYPLQNKNVS